jgi:hypothetical protein
MSTPEKVGIQRLVASLFVGATMLFPMQVRADITASAPEPALTHTTETLPPVTTSTGTATGTATLTSTGVGTGIATRTATRTATPTPTGTPTPSACEVKVWLVDFQGRPAERPGNYEVVYDRLNQTPLRIDDFEHCPKIKDQVEWKDCVPTWPDGSSEKNWPVAFVRGNTVTIKEARFKVRSDMPLPEAAVTGTANLPDGGLLEFQQVGVYQRNELVIRNVVSAGLRDVFRAPDD